ncbi:MAG: hypothetical protein KDH09_05420 [Chrysiogenetes bacterium]|nr:hypothetical protein [Chrysiogenetes bacterium]
MLALLQACAQVGAHLSPEYSAHAPKKIAVLAPRSNVGDGAGGEELAEQSALLLEAAGYEVLRELEVKAALGETEPAGDPAALAAQLGVDALLHITVLRWDYRARIYASDYTVAAGFRLVAADGTELWRVDEHSESLSRETRQGHPQESFRAGGEDEFERLAARLVARVFDTLPPRAGIPGNQ